MLNNPTVTYYNHVNWGYTEKTLDLKMSCQETLNIICSSIWNAEILGKYLVSSAQSETETTREFLKEFLIKIKEDINLSDFAMEVKPEKKGTELDFRRPSPSIKLFRLFLNVVSQSDNLAEVLRETEYFNRRVENEW